MINLVVRTAISQFATICATLPLGSVATRTRSTTRGSAWAGCLPRSSTVLRRYVGKLQRRHSAAGGQRRAAPWAKPSRVMRQWPQCKDRSFPTDVANGSNRLQCGR